MLIKWNNRDLTPSNLNSWLENFWGRDLFGDAAPSKKAAKKKK